ncbi:hypothetical protein AV656_03125 [Bhargavaea cecembensis]|uniref:Cthe-2314-like HEPN domain-containing protein n=1 Tax=Bhargavaea cecembensis TaxID=394098 RepID=A0A165HK53_9BACL|nr:Cthe_2314 family HEPN domain-containing protein [Bhargavaea cecembensis]KZE40269.1 hypothetical protein AV656_03125 [Bhargavaea cecembensis]
MTIYIKPFENIENVKLSLYRKDNPLAEYQIPEGLFDKEGSFLLMLKGIDVFHWKRLLRNRLRSLDVDFAYSMYYFEKGIPDDEWVISPGLQGQSTQYFPHFRDEHYSNQYNFNFFVDTFFLKAFTVFETIGHLLYKYDDLPLNKDDFRDKVSFNSAIYKLKGKNVPLQEELYRIKKSEKYKEGIRMRNDIAHNHPPYQITSGVTISGKAGSFGVGAYVTSKEIRQIMIGLLESIKETFEALETHLIPNKN